MKHLLNFYPIESFCENGGYVDVLKKLFEDKDRVTWWPGIMIINNDEKYVYSHFYFRKNKSKD